MDKIKVIVTGGAGFIGSHISEYWISQGAEVHVIDNLRTGYLSNIDKINGVKFHKVSITERDKIFKIFPGTVYVHHLAAFVSVPESISKPNECYDINVNGLINILDASKEFGVRKIIFSSTAAVYGDNPVSPKNIDLKPNPKSPYGETKVQGELLLNDFNLLSDIGAISLRYFNVFGPRQDPKSQYAAAIPIFIGKAIKNEPITIYGDGTQTRDFIYVQDVVNVNVLAAKNEQFNGVLNVASGKAISINEIVNVILKLTGSKSKIIYSKERDGDIKHSLASIEETKQKFNFYPEYDLERGLKMTIDYFRSLHTKNKF